MTDAVRVRVFDRYESRGLTRTESGATRNKQIDKIRRIKMSMRKQNIKQVGLIAVLLLLGALFFSCEQSAGIDSALNNKPENEEPESGGETGEERQITGIKIISPPETTVYGRNATFDPSGLEVGWLYDDDSTVPMEDDEWLIVTEPDMAKYTMHEVTVKAAGYEDDDAYQDSFWINVMNSDKVLQSITASYAAGMTQTLGTDFDKAGLTVTGQFSDGSTQNLKNFAVITGYSKKWRGEQTLTAKVNGKTATFTVTSRIGTAATISVNKPGQGLHNDQNTEYKEAWIKDEPFAPEKLNLMAKVTMGGGAQTITLTYGPGGLTDTDFTSTIAAYKPDQAGAQSVPFSIEGRNFTLDLYTINAAPDVWFDYGYMRHDGDSTGAGKGAGIDNGKYYARVNETLVIAPVRYLVGYDADHNATAGTTYSWAVSGSDSDRTYTTSNGGELLSVTPKVAGTYTVSVTVGGKTYFGGDFSKNITADIVCYSGTVSNNGKTFDSPLRNFACGQMCEGGTGLGWSLGSAGGYEVWTVTHQPSYSVSGNAFAGWHEAGIVWVQEDRNGNGLPDEMWYELRGCDDDDPAQKNKITRRYAVTYVKGPGHGTVNEYDQLIRSVYWADSKGRAGRIPGGFPDTYWGVSGDRVTYTLTLLRDDGRIANGDDYGGILFTANGYVDAIGENYYVKDAMRADGTNITLSAVKFIKVQTAIFRYGGVFGDVSTEIHSAEFLGPQTTFPLP
jgi:hypothetical protein